MLNDSFKDLSQHYPKGYRLQVSWRANTLSWHLQETRPWYRPWKRALPKEIQHALQERLSYLLRHTTRRVGGQDADLLVLAQGPLINTIGVAWSYDGGYWSMTTVGEAHAHTVYDPYHLGTLIQNTMPAHSYLAYWTPHDAPALNVWEGASMHAKMRANHFGQAPDDRTLMQSLHHRVPAGAAVCVLHQSDTHPVIAAYFFPPSHPQSPQWLVCGHQQGRS